MKAAIFTLGCKVNQYESQEMKTLLHENGYLIVEPNENADVYIVNSCTVTAESTRKTRQAVRRFKSLHPNSAVVLTGCVPQAFPDEATAINEADIILGNKNNINLISSLKKWFEERNNIIDIKEHQSDDKFEGIIIKEFEGHTRAFVKIQDGCNRFCSYCAIPFARGRSRSKPLDDVKKEISALALEGFKEIVFVGINLSAYGIDLGLSLTDAVKAAQATEGVERIRLGSLEPDHITKEMIETFAECDKFCPQFHLSLQSGSDTVLKRMNRHYNSAEYEELVNNLRSVFPDCAITTDIITGFPGETREEFEETVNFVKKIRFEKVHVFPYSVRKGTRAEKAEGHLPSKIKSERASELSNVAEEIRLEIFKSLAENKARVKVLFESPKNGYLHGYTPNYTPVKVKTNLPLTGKIADVIIDSCDSDSCEGHLAE